MLLNLLEILIDIGILLFDLIVLLSDSPPAAQRASKNENVLKFFLI